MFGSALDNLYKEVMEEHPSELRRTVISSPALYGPLVMQPVAALPAMAVPLPQPAVAVPIPAAPVAVAAPPPVIEQRRDPVANNLYVDDRYMRAMLRNSDRNSSRESSPPPAPPPPPEPPRQPTAREIELHHELMCVGAGNKPGCGSWDGGKGQTLRGR